MTANDELPTSGFLNVALAAVLAAGTAASAEPRRVSFRESRLATLTGDFNHSSLTASPDYGVFAYATKLGGKESVVAGNKKGPAFDEVGFPELSPDGKTVAYAARSGKAWSMVVNGRKGDDFDYVSFPTFSQDGKFLAYEARAGNKEFVVVDGRRGPKFDGVADLSLKPGGVLLYQARQGERWFVVTGAVREEMPGYSHEIALSPAKGTPAYAVEGKDGKESVIVRGKRGEAFDRVWGLTWSPDGTKTAFMARSGEREFLVVGDKKGPAFDYVEEHIEDASPIPVTEGTSKNVSPPAFSPDGKRVAYRAHGEGNVFIVTDGVEGEIFDDASQQVFSPDGKRLAYTARNGSSDYLVVDGRKGPAFENVWGPVFSPDGKTVAYKASGPYSKDKGLKEFIVAGEARGPEFDRVWEPVFSKDGRKVAYLALQGREVWRKVLEAR
ncbi:MAG: PD40 domain-containing protein [Elusimicrobia bacterium]|nr:PD40 domain-containing protein [Elusimicrobiota bacterium]